ncbi:MAG: hypothetical protein Q9187_001017 [Circinaria calcarea]
MAGTSGKRPVKLTKKNPRNSILPIIQLLKRNDARSKKRHDRLSAKLNRILEALESTKPAAPLDLQPSHSTDLPVVVTRQPPRLEGTPKPAGKPIPKCGDRSICGGTKTTKTHHQQFQPPFFSLPPELRNEIYDMVLVSARPIMNPYDQTARIRDDSTERIGDINSSVLMTCRLLDPYEVSLFNNSGNQGYHISCGRSQRMARVRLRISTQVYGDRFRGMAQQAKAWVDKVFGEEKDWGEIIGRRPKASYLFAGLQELTLDFSTWMLGQSDRFPPSLLKAIKGTAWRLQRLTLVGLEEHDRVKEELE